AQLRRLLARAGTVSSLLKVQEQINAQESDLEALQSQQRALARETAYGTVSVRLVSKQAPPPARPVKLASGFTGGPAAGRARPPRAHPRRLAGPAGTAALLLIVVIPVV